MTTTPTLEKALAAMLVSDRLWLKGVYESVAEVIKADGLVDEPEITTVSTAMKIHESVKRFVTSGMHGTYPGLINAIDREVNRSLSEASDGFVTPRDRDRLVSAYDKIAWSGLGSDE